MKQSFDDFMANAGLIAHEPNDNPLEKAWDAALMTAIEIIRETDSAREAEWVIRAYIRGLG